MSNETTEVVAYDFYEMCAGAEEQSVGEINVPAAKVIREFDLEDRNRMWRRCVAMAAQDATDDANGECSERIAKAKMIVLDNGVRLGDPGQPSLVSSQGETEIEHYVVHEDACTCPDYVHSQAPLGICKHRLAVRLYKRARSMGAELVDMLRGTLRQQVVHRYPEAPVSINVRGLAHGRDAQVTLRHWDPNMVCDLLAVADGSLDAKAARQAPVSNGHVPSAPAPVPPTQHPEVGPPCPVHARPMKPSQIQGVQWYCTRKVGEGFCDQVVRLAS